MQRNLSCDVNMSDTDCPLLKFRRFSVQPSFSAMLDTNFDDVHNAKLKKKSKNVS